MVFNLINGICALVIKLGIGRWNAEPNKTTSSNTKLIKNRTLYNLFHIALDALKRNPVCESCK